MAHDHTDFRQDRGARDFHDLVFRHTVGHAVTTLAYLGDRLGLFQALAQGGPANSEDLASRAGIAERNAREWLCAMTCAGYVSYLPDRQVFELPPEHLPVLVQETSPLFMAAMQQMLMGISGQAGRFVDAFRAGHGVSPDSYGDDVWVGMERLNATWCQTVFLDLCLPQMQIVKQKLEAGARFAEIGCGRGAALIRLAHQFPRSSFVGYDKLEAAILVAEEHAQSAGVAGRVRFQVKDGGLPYNDRYDVIATFAVVHDALDPVALLRAIHEALDSGGSYLCMEVNSSERLEDNLGEAGAFFYSISTMFCTSISLFEGGAALGTLGLPKVRLQELAAMTGYTGFRTVLETPIVAVYEMRA